MSNNKQIEKPLELPHQETIVGTNTIQTKPFDNQKTMSNNKQSSSIEWYAKQIDILHYDYFNEHISKDEKNQRLKQLLEQAKAMHKDEIEEAYWEGGIDIPSNDQHCQQYYNETFGGNNEQ